MKYVQAAGQATILQAWQPILTDAEKDVVRRGRNAKGGVPRHADTMEYRYSTGGFEALLGYLYLSGQRGGRLKELLEKSIPRLILKPGGMLMQVLNNGFVKLLEQMGGRPGGNPQCSALLAQ